MTHKVFVTRSLPARALERLRQFVPDIAMHDDEAVLDEAGLCARVGDATGLLVPGDTISRAVIDAAPRLRAVANVSVGYNNLDLTALNERGIVATNTPDVLNETTADLGWALMMAAARRITEAEHYLRAGRWKHWRFDLLTGSDVYGSTLGIVGMGRIGQALARRAAGFGMRVVYHNRSRVAPEIEQALRAEYLSKEALMREADHIIVVVPYSPQSRGLIGAAEIAAMKPSATLTNIARGGIVDEGALIEALAARRIAGAGLDVFEGEPDFDARFLTLDNVVLTPHIGSASEPTRMAMADLAIDNLVAALGLGPRAGQPANPVNPQVLAAPGTAPR